MKRSLWVGLCIASSLASTPVDLHYPLEGQWILGAQVKVELRAPAGSQVEYKGVRSLVDSTEIWNATLDLDSADQSLNLSVISQGQSYALSRKLIRSEGNLSPLGSKWWIYPITVSQDAIYVSPQWQKSLAQNLLQEGVAGAVLLEMPSQPEIHTGMDLKRAQTLGVQFVLQTQLIVSPDQRMQWDLSLWDVQSLQMVHRWQSQWMSSKSELSTSLLRVADELRHWEKPLAQTPTSASSDRLISPQTIPLSGALPPVLDRTDLPYVLSGVCTIPESQNTVVQPGVQLWMGPGASIQIFGTSQWLGTAQDPIVIRAQNVQQNWAGLQIESNLPTRLQHVNLSQAQVGIHAVSSNVWMDQVRISQMDKAGLVLENTDLEAQNVQISELPYGMVLDAYSAVHAQNLSIEQSSVGLLVQGQSTLKGDQLQFKRNQKALVLGQNYSLDLQNPFFKDNENGVLNVEGSAVDLSTLKSLQLESSGQSLAQISHKDYAQILQPLGLEDEVWIPSYRKSRFKSGAQIAIDDGAGPSTWAGSLKMGTDYQRVQTQHITQAKPYLYRGDSLQKGMLYPNRFRTPGFNNKISFFASQQDSLSRLEFSADLWQNQWNDVWVNPINLFSERGHQRFWFGDYRIGLHDLSMGSGPIFGARYEWKSNGDLRKKSLLKWDFFGGEWKAARAIGDREPESYDNIVEQGNGQAQRLGAGTRLHLGRDANFWEMAWISLRDTRKSWLRPVLDDSVKLRSPLIQSNHLYVQNKGVASQGALEWGLFAGAGSADSTEGFRARAIEFWLNDNNIIEQKDTLKILLSKTSPNLALISLSLPAELNLTPRQVIKEIDSLENQLVQKQDQKRPLPLLGMGPSDLAIRTELSYTLKSNRYGFRADYVGNRYFSPAEPSQNRREFELFASLKWGGQWTQKWRSFFKEENVSADDQWHWGFEDGDLWGIQKWTENPFASRGTGVSSPRYEFQNSVENRFSFGQGWELSADYELRWAHQLQERTLRKDTSAWMEMASDPYFHTSAESVKSTLEQLGHRWTVQKDLYENWLNAPDILASVYQQRWLDHRLKFELRRKWNKIWQSKWGVLTQFRVDESRFGQSTSWLSNLESSSLARLGYLPGGDGFWSVKIPLGLQFNWEPLPIKLDFYFGTKSWKRQSELQQDLGLDFSAKWNLIERRLDFEPSFHLRKLWDRKTDVRAYLQDNSGLNYYHISQDSAGAITPIQNETILSTNVQAGQNVQGFTLLKESYHRFNRETDLSLVPLFRLRIADAWSMVMDGVWEIHARPDALSESYHTWRAGANLNYNF